MIIFTHDNGRKVLWLKYSAKSTFLLQNEGTETGFLIFFLQNKCFMSFLWMKVKRSKKQEEKEFSMPLFLYSRVMEINYTTAISK